MRLVTFKAGEEARLGALLRDGSTLDLVDAARRRGVQPFPDSMQSLIEAGASAWDVARLLIEQAPEDAIIRAPRQLLAPLPRPLRLRDCSLFLDHMEAALRKMAQISATNEADPEAALEALMASGKYSLKPIFKQQVVYYNADHLHVVGPDEDVVWPGNSSWMDYELEWACVVGKTASNVSAGDARAHIFGVTIFNDWSARDIQLPIMEANLGPGEGKDFANGLGPCIATLDEFADPYALAMTAHVNGELWSRGTTASMHHRFEDAIVQFSRDKVLYAGEVIGSGTVLTGCGFELGRQLSDGDLVELAIDGIGTLRNRVVRQQQRR